jgi:hypothetical protein
MRRQLRPVAKVDGQRIAVLIRDLDDERFETRENATRELERTREQAAVALREALSTQPPPERRKRIESLLTKLDEPPVGDDLRALRALEIIEAIGTPEACRLLESLGTGAPEAQLTREARASLARWGKKFR